MQSSNLLQEQVLSHSTNSSILGKTLSLLCSALAWQKWSSQDRLGKGDAHLDKKIKPDFQQFKYTKSDSVTLDSKDSEEEVSVSREDDDFQEFNIILNKKGIETNISSKENNYPHLKKLLENRNETPVRIYYGSRTHRQIAQIVSELKASAYRPRMTVLGSRQHYCIHKEVKSKPNKNEECATLVDLGSCKFHDRFRNLAVNKAFEPGGSLEIWDIEDLVSTGEKVKGCPYYASRLLAYNAEIIFCPYNYLVDSNARDAMDIKLHNSIVILDEAHNIEDVCRTAASMEITDGQLLRINVLILIC
jgi:fanconi anemia group J protein